MNGSVLTTNRRVREATSGCDQTQGVIDLLNGDFRVVLNMVFGQSHHILHALAQIRATESTPSIKICQA
jgi:hypothetical protein